MTQQQTDTAPKPSAASSRFDVCLHFVLTWEGGCSDDAADSGGLTCLGIEDREYRAWRAAHGLPDQSVRLMTHDEAGTIYRGNYWEPCHCPGLPAPVDLVAFDTGVNMGNGRAVRFLQQALGLTADGVFGPATSAAVHAIKDAHGVAWKMCDLREAKYRAIVAANPSQSVFLNGWLNRLQALRHLVNQPA